MENDKKKIEKDKYKSDCPYVWTIKCFSDQNRTGKYEEWVYNIPFFKKFFLSAERKNVPGMVITKNKYLIVQNNQMLIVTVIWKKPDDGSSFWYPLSSMDIEIERIKLSDFDPSYFKED